MFLLLPSPPTDLNLRTDPRFPFLLHLTHRQYLAVQHARYLHCSSRLQALALKGNKKRVRKHWAEQVESPEHRTSGKDKIQRQHGFPGLEHFLLPCQCFPSSHHTNSVFVLPASKANPLPPQNPLQPLKEKHNQSLRACGGLTLAGRVKQTLNLCAEIKTI